MKIKIFRHSNNGFDFSFQNHKPELKGVFGCHVFVHMVDPYLLSGKNWKHRLNQNMHQKLVDITTPAYVRNIVVSIEKGKPVFSALTEDASYASFILADLSIPYENAKFCIENGIEPEFSIEAIIFKPT